jgi:hypothetical protein
MSPGLTARPSGMFSQAGTSPTRLSLSSLRAAKSIAANTVAAPHMSNFISSMAGGSLSEMPPVSKVTPLPTSTSGARLRRAPRYSSTMKRGGSALPRVTARKQPILRRRMPAHRICARAGAGGRCARARAPAPPDSAACRRWPADCPDRAAAGRFRLAPRRRRGRGARPPVPQASTGPHSTRARAGGRLARRIFRSLMRYRLAPVSSAIARPK